MAAREVALRLGIRAWERAVSLGDRIKVSVQKSVDLTKEARREIGAAVRERSQAARLFGQRARDLEKRGDAVTEAARRSALDERTALGIAGQRLSFGGQALTEAREKANNAVNLLSGGGIQGGASLLNSALGGSAVAAIAAAVLVKIKTDIDNLIDSRRKDVADLVALQVQEGLRTLEERLRTEPLLAEGAAEDAARAFDAYQKALADGQLTPAAVYLEGE